MTKNIVIFGCDNTGKTTLANKLSEYFKGVNYFKSLGPNKTAVEQMKFMQESIVTEGINVFDRFPLIEEATSGVVLRNCDNFNVWGPKEKEILSNIDLFILCYPGLFDTLNWGAREQLEGVKENALSLIDAYNNMAATLRFDLRLDVIEYNYKAGFSEWVKVVNKINKI